MTTAPNLKWAVLLPMYNEESNVDHCIRRLTTFFDREGYTADIYCVNDGSRDGTAAALDKAKAEFGARLHVITHDVNKGYGGAMRSGFAHAAANNLDYLIVMDGDGTQDPKYLANFFDPMQRGITFIKASRYTKGGRVENVHWKRIVISWLGNKLAKMIFRLPVSDYTNGFRAAHRSLFNVLTQSKERGFSVLMEEVKLARKAGATFAEVPYTLVGRPAAASASKFVYSLAVYKSYLKHLR
jgi:dolichol-phosphate mannosyltransferase